MPWSCVSNSRHGGRKTDDPRGRRRDVVTVDQPRMPAVAFGKSRPTLDSPEYADAGRLATEGSQPADGAANRGQAPVGSLPGTRAFAFGENAHTATLRPQTWAGLRGPRQWIPPGTWHRAMPAFSSGGCPSTPELPRTPGKAGLHNNLSPQPCLFNASRYPCNPASQARYRAGVDGRYAVPGLPSSRSSARSSRPCGPSRKSP